MTLVSLVMFVGGILGLIVIRYFFHQGFLAVMSLGALFLAVMSFGALFLLLTEPATTVGPNESEKAAAGQ